MDIWEARCWKKRPVWSCDFANTNCKDIMPHDRSSDSVETINKDTNAASSMVQSGKAITFS